MSAGPTAAVTAGQEGRVRGVHADRDRGAAAPRRVADRLAAGRVVQRRDDDHAVRVQPSGAGQRDRGPGRPQACRGDQRREPPQPRPVRGGQAQAAEDRGGESDGEHHLGDREVGQVPVEGRHTRGDADVEGARGQRRDLPVRVVSGRRLGAEREPEEGGHGDQRGDETAREQGPGGEADRGQRGDARDADDGRPPQRAAPGGLPGGHDVDHRDAGQAADLGPGRGGGPGGELAGPARPGGHPEQVRQVPAAFPGAHPRGRAGRRDDEVEQQRGSAGSSRAGSTSAAAP